MLGINQFRCGQFLPGPRARGHRAITAGMRVLAFLGAGITLFAALSAGAGQAINVSGEDKLALKGYDAVGYFEDGHAAMGSKDFEYSWQGANWRFYSAAHRDAFAANPERYAPEYGGYSAFGIAEGQVADADPASWTIYNGKLYLNTSESDRKQWLAAFVGYIGTANNKWPKIESSLLP